MRIIINKKAWTDFDDEYYQENYDLNTVIEIGEDANAYDSVKAFAKAMSIEGYLTKSILQAMKDYAEFEAYEEGIKLESDDEERGEF